MSTPPRMTVRRRALPWPVLALLVLGLACRPAAPAPGYPQRQREPAARDPLAAPWVIRPSASSFGNEIRLDAILSSRTDSLEHTDTLHTILAGTWSLVAGARPPRLSGLVSEFRVGVGDDSLQSPEDLRFPFPFVATLEPRGRQPAFTAPRPDACGSAGAAVQTLREVFLSAPDTLTPDLAWSDSANYLVCRDSIPLTIRSVRQFRVLGAVSLDDEILVRVARTSSTSLSGDGTQLGEPLSISGTGTATMILELRLAGGAVVSGRGESELTLTMRGRRRTQELLQHTWITVAAP
jgi:hypothetical protein